MLDNNREHHKYNFFQGLWKGCGIITICVEFVYILPCITCLYHSWSYCLLLHSWVPAACRSPCTAPPWWGKRSRAEYRNIVGLMFYLRAAPYAVCLFFWPSNYWGFQIESVPFSNQFLNWENFCKSVKNSDA